MLSIADEAAIPKFILNDGTTMPSVGLGCWMGEAGNDERVYQMCLDALKVGYRHIDTADWYGNEEEVGRAIRDSGIPREDIYLTTKLHNTMHHRVQEAFERSLAALECGYIDLCLVHWPIAIVDGVVKSPEEAPTVLDTWLAMQSLLAASHSSPARPLRSIGVSNFSLPLLRALLSAPQLTTVPAVNQVEAHPYRPQAALAAFCAARGVRLVAYAPLGQGSRALFDDAVVARIASARGVPHARVVLSWAVQRGVGVIPKSADPGRMRENIDLITLTEAEMHALSSLHTDPGKHRSLCEVYHDEAGKGVVFGWTYEQLGWNMGKGGVVLGEDA